MKNTIKVKRIYDAPQASDGFRVLVDRLWPRGIKKTEAAIDLWLKEIAPSDALRKWFNHDPEKWVEFKKRYFKELAHKQALLAEIPEKARAHKITLLYAAKDEDHNNAIALQEYLSKLRKK